MTSKLEQGRDSAVGQPTLSHMALLLLAVFAVSSSAALVRWTDVSAITIAFWRTFGGALILAGPAWRIRQERAIPANRNGRAGWLFSAVAGTALALHFATWLTSLELTSAAASLTLAATAPIFVAGWWWLNGRPPSARAWVAIAVAIVGVAVIAGGSLLEDATNLRGNALALIGAVTAAAYMVAGERAQEELPIATYAFRAYFSAAVVLTVIAAVSGDALWSGAGNSAAWDRKTVLALVLFVVGPQLLGHTVLNSLLPRIGSLSVTMALLAEPILGSLLVWLWFSEVPTAAVWIGAPLVIGGLAFQLWDQARGVREGSWWPAPADRP